MRNARSTPRLEELRRGKCLRRCCENRAEALPAQGRRPVEFAVENQETCSRIGAFRRLESVQHVLAAAGFYRKDGAKARGAAAGSRSVELAVGRGQSGFRICAVAAALEVIDDLGAAGGGRGEHRSVKMFSAGIGRSVELTAETYQTGLRLRTVKRRSEVMQHLLVAGRA